MPQALRKSHNSGTEIIVWEVSESADFFLPELSEYVFEDKEYISAKFEWKKLELLAARYAAKVLVESMGYSFKGIAKDEYGKPYLVDSTLEMSLTHSKAYVAVAIHKTQKLGIDLERPAPKMWRIKDRLFTNSEVQAIGEELEKMSIFWSAKEGLYKLYGKRGIDFKENLFLGYEQEDLLGFINLRSGYQSKHRVYVERFLDFLLVWVV